jgi:hypothetical protein
MVVLEVVANQITYLVTTCKMFQSIGRIGEAYYFGVLTLSCNI